MALPASLNTATVTAKYTKYDGTAESGTVDFAMPPYLRNSVSNDIVTPGTFTATLDGDGAISIVVIRTDDADFVPVNWTYTVVEKLSGGKTRTYTIEVTGDVNLADVSPVENPSLGDTYILLNSIGVTGGPAGPLTAAGRIPVGQNALSTVVTVLTDAASIATNAALGNHFRVTLGGNRALAAPTNPTDGQRVIWEIIQDGAGNRTLTYDPIFTFGALVTGAVVSTTADKRDFLGAVYNAAVDKWYVTAFANGY